MSNTIALTRLLSDKISCIPQKNKEKFFVDLLRLIDYASKDDYDNFNF